jgi:catechol 2,3-dioxygenase-like lactoylglutathione lyase family enzyme
MPKLFRIILPVTDIDRAVAFYTRVLGFPGKRVWSNRHSFNCDGTILVCLDPRGEGGRSDAPANPEHVYISVPDLEVTIAAAQAAGCLDMDAIQTRPWGERSFYGRDPFGNPICFVDEQTIFLG